MREYTSTESFSHLPLTFFHYVERGRHERFTILRTCICFRMCLPPDPIQCHFILKTRTWNSRAILMNFHDDLHPPDPNQRQICKKKYGLNHFRTCLGGGRAMRASEFVSMTLIGVRGNAWKKHCPPLWGLSTQCPLFFNHFHNIV